MRSANDSNQEVISTYFDVKIIDEIQQCIQNEPELENVFSSSAMMASFAESQRCTGLETGHLGPLLKALVQSTFNNSSKALKGRRYETSLKKFACTLYLLSGKIGYEILYANLKSSLPSLTTIKMLLDKETESFKAGVLRVSQLKAWLLKRNLELRVSVAEDQTKITESIQYNEKENCLDGLSLPLGCNGFLKPNPFSAKNAKEIKKSIEEGEVAAYINVFMVQPQTDQKSPGFCLTAYPTNSRFRL